MKKITLAKALKLKNKLVRDLGAVTQEMLSSNSYLEENEPVYNSREKLKEIETVRLQLIELKTKLTQGNKGIQSDIFELGELKSYAKYLSHLDTSEGTKQDRYNGGNKTVFKATIKAIEKNTLVKEVEKKIEEIQERIETYNHSTKIEVSFLD